MKTITFTCKTTTPMFLNGADGQTPELRPASIKGALRFWWRAMNGHLAEMNQKVKKWDYKKLTEAEGKLFGGTGDNASRSSLIIQIKNTNLNILNKAELVPHKPSMTQKAIAPKQEFEVIFRFRDEKQTELYQSLFVLIALLGGIGKRVRRGMGSFTIHKIAIGEDDIVFKMPKTLAEINTHLNKVSPHQFGLKNEKIISLFNKNPDYPYIKSIEIGNADSRILHKISNTTHITKEKNPQNYDVSLGTTYRGRFASPIYVSVLEGNIPIITTLNTVPSRDIYKVSTNVQEEFKQKIL